MERKIYATYFGDEKLPVEWKNDEEKDLMWFYDDLHCPHPISPLYFSIGGWWGSTCEYMYRRFGAPIGSNWLAKKIGGYVYTAIVPPKTDPDKVQGMFAYYSAVMPIYADTFLDRWEKNYIPELKAAGDTMIGFDFDHSTIPECLIHLEDCLDLQERAFRIHWIMNLAQVQASGEFQGIYAKAVGAIDEDYAKITISKDDRNWDSLRTLWQIKEAINKKPEVKEFFLKNSVADIMAGLKDIPGGNEIFEMFEAYRKEYGFKAIWSHEYIFKTWYEDPTPVYEAVKGYVETNYDFNQNYNSCMKTQSDAIERARAKITDESLRQEFEQKLALCLKMMPLTPNHHFYIDQSIYAHMRIMLLGIGRQYVKAGKLDDAEDIFMLTYEEIRCSGASDYYLKDIVKQRRQEMAEAAKIHPRYWYGTVDHWQLYEEIYKRSSGDIPRSSRRK
jgi:pyruvate,water dikinase